MNHTVPVLCNRAQVDVVYFNLSKASDLVDHALLLSKLRSMGVQGRLLGWFGSYLTNQRSSVQAGESYSHSCHTPPGVPQTSGLKTLLFNLFANDICSCVSQSWLPQFTDGMKIFQQIQARFHCSDLQKYVNAASKWCFINNLRLYKEKGKVVT